MEVTTKFRERRVGRDLMEQTERVQRIQLKEAIVPKKNKACFFILPLLGQPMYWYNDFINCYLGDIINKPELTQENIFIHLKSYDGKLLTHPHFKQSYQLEDDSYMYIFDIPKRFVDDYSKFCDGKYSEMSEDAKVLICKCSGVKPVMNSVVYKVLYKTTDQKEKIEALIGQKLSLNAEVYSIPNLDREIYSLHSIKSRSKDLERRESEPEKV